MNRTMVTVTLDLDSNGNYRWGEFTLIPAEELIIIEGVPVVDSEKKVVGRVLGAEYLGDKIEMTIELDKGVLKNG